MSNSALDTSKSSVTNLVGPPAPEPNLLQTAKGGSITFAGKLFTYASRLIITVILARLLGAEHYGLYNLSITALTVTAVLSAIGLDSAMIRYIAVFARRRDDAGLWGTLQIGLLVTTATSIALGIGLFSLADRIAVSIFSEPRLAGLLRLASIFIPLLALNNVLASATQGFKKMQYATIARDFVQPLLRLVLILLLALIGASVAGALLVYGLAIGASTCLLLYYLHGLFSLRRPLRRARRHTKELFSFSAPVFLTDLMTTFRVNIQTLLLGAMSTVANVGIFTVANQITVLGHTFHTAITTAARPIIAELYDQREWAQMRQMYQTTTKWTVTVNLPLFLILVLLPDELLSIFGQSFAAGASALILLAASIMIDVATGMCGVIIDMTGHTTLKLVNAIARLVTTIGLSAWLIPAWGVMGAATAALAAVATMNLLRLLEVYLLFRLLPYNASFFKPITAGLAALSASLALELVIPVQGHLLHTLLQLVVLLLVYVGMIILLGLSAEDRVMLAHARRRIHRLRRRRKRDDHQPQV